MPPGPHYQSVPPPKIPQDGRRNVAAVPTHPIRGVPGSQTELLQAVRYTRLKSPAAPRGHELSLNLTSFKLTG